MVVSGNYYFEMSVNEPRISVNQNRYAVLSGCIVILYCQCTYKFVSSSKGSKLLSRVVKNYFSQKFSFNTNFVHTGPFCIYTLSQMSLIIYCIVLNGNQKSPDCVRQTAQQRPETYGFIRVYDSPSIESTHGTTVTTLIRIIHISDHIVLDCIISYERAPGS
jgi:hypothetical protein